MARIDDLKKKRESLQSRIVTVQAKIVGYDPLVTSVAEMKVIEKGVDGLQTKLDELYEDTFIACTLADFAPHQTEFDTLFNSLNVMMSKVAAIVAPTVVKPPHAVTITPYKEKVDLPSFDGTITKWKTFHDLFLHKVKVEGITSGASKLAILQVKLVGDAATVISNVALTDANFDSAWDRLVKRFEDKRDLVHAHIGEFDNSPSLVSESARGLRSLLDTINNMMLSLKNIGVNISDSDVFIVYYSVKKLDPKTRAWWALAPKSDVATVTELCEFLELRAKALMETPTSSSSSISKQHTAPTHSTGTQKKTHYVSSSTCYQCSSSHPLWQCSSFKALPVQERWNLVKAKQLCFNCLRQHDKGIACPSSITCRVQDCGKAHHSLLHPTNHQTSHGGAETQPKPTPGRAVLKPKRSSHSCIPRRNPESVAILGTVIVDVKDSNGVKQPCRVFVDDGSEVDFISEHCLLRLGLKRQKTFVPLNVIGNMPGRPAKGKVQICLESRSEQFALELEALVLPQFTGLVPGTHCYSNWPHLKGLKLSDPQYHRAHLCDILLGGKKSGHILLPQVVQDVSNPNAPVAWNTRFGWMLKGEAPSLTAPSRPINRNSSHVTVSTSPLESSVARFWAQEDSQNTQRDMSMDDMECEAHFTSTHSRNPDGTYTVQLPFKQDARRLGKSRDAAVRRFLRVEERLSRNPHIKAEYAKSINEFLELGYIEPVPAEENHRPPSTSYYMPHREVLKDSSSSTKVRIVFDASAKTPTGTSLNDILHVGPKLQADLFPLLIRFMSHRIAVSADIWKFYPQTTIHPKHRDFHRLIWRDSPNKPLRDLRMTRVTFGVSSAPFLAIRSLHQMADDTTELPPHVAKIIKNDFLVDNLLSGAPTIEAALTLQTDLLTAMHLRNLKLLKWASNSPQVLAAVPPELRDPSASLAIDEGDFIKTIGILWNPREDTFSIQIQVPPLPTKTTKRTILSKIARTFDPLGWLTPVTLRPKLLLQELWKSKLSWDEPIPPPLYKQWTRYCEELPVLNKISIDRCAFAPPAPASKNWTHQLHGFCDGSDAAHAACVYIRTVDTQGRVVSRLLTAKSHVNPVVKTTTPRSELCGAVLLTNLVYAVQKSVNIPFTSIHCWTDSTVVLGRISPAKKLPVFELIRIRKILERFPASHWHHVKGEENPADAPSRGISASSLLNHHLWLHGPPWLLGPIPDPVPATSALNVAVISSSVSDLLRTCSSFSKMRIRMGYVLRFVHNARTGKKARKTGPVSALELSKALNWIVKIIQAEEFPQELEDCSRALPLKSPWKFLTPFIDNSGILRVGGRLDRANLPFNKKHPALLPKEHPFTETYVRHLHLTHLHPGPSLLLSIIREQFWIRRGRGLVARITHACVVCHRHRTTKSHQLMGQLPPSRVNPAPVFSQTGMDYAGPFNLASRTGRKPPMTKAYVALFICMATKAIHLELASDLSTASFLAALQRFISRRGYPSDLYSDGGTNFVGAKSELVELRALLESSSHENAMHHLLTSKGTSFHFNPPAAPHHGGLWEAGVKSMKHHLRRVMGSRHLTIEEFSTLLCSVEAILNSRPLTQLTEDPQDCSVLTPGHFLIGRPLVALPHPDLTDINENRLDRWQMVQVITQHFWKAWSRDYLSQLQARPKWFSPLPNLTSGTLVLIMDDSAFGPQQWKLGRIIDVFPGKDGKTRVCDVRTNVTKDKPTGSVFRRPVTKLSPLPIY